MSKFEKISLGTVQRPANEVLNEALAWKEQRQTFFTWIHLYDPHTPYAPPPSYDKKYSVHPYLGEIAFADSQIGRLWRFLEANDLVRNSFLVIAGVHGESLGEHEESTHGFFVYQGTIHVPLIFVTPWFHFGWSEFKALQNARYKLILAPVPELYDTVKDPGETKNLVYLEKKAFAGMNAAAERFISKSEKNGYQTDMGKVDEGTREKLAALGYLGAFTDSSKLQVKKLANPKEKIAVFNELNRAREIGMSGKAEEAIRIIEGIISSDPEITDAYFTLGNIYVKEKKFEKAISSFQQALDKKPDDSFTIINIANSFVALQKFDPTENIVLDFFKKDFEDAQLYFLLGTMNFARKNYDQASLYYEKRLALNPESASAHNALAAIALAQDDLAKAETHIQIALTIDRRLSEIHYNLAQILEKKGRTAANLLSPGRSL